MNPLVSPAWVAQRIHEPGFVVVDATLPPVGITPAIDVHARYLAQHLPGAIFFDTEALSEKATTLPHMLPTPENFAAAMGELGIGDRMTIVVYEQVGVFSAPRAWWMLRVFGAEAVYMLDGGLTAWVEAGLGTQAGPVQRPAATFHATAPGDSVVSLPEMKSRIAEGAQILDARSAGRFVGTAPEPRAGISSGHMPGATNVPYTELVVANHLRPPAELQAVFTAKGVALHKPITTTCGSGVTAAVIALAAEICGADHVSLYDGSWAEYAQDSEAVIETSS